MKKFKASKFINGLFTFFGVVLVCYQLFFAGFNAAHHWYGSMGLDLILAGMWIGFLIILQAERIMDIRFESNMNEVKSFEKFIELLAKMEAELKFEPKKQPEKPKSPGKNIPVKGKSTSKKVPVKRK